MNTSGRHCGKLWCIDVDNALWVQVQNKSQTAMALLRVGEILAIGTTAAFTSYSHADGVRFTHNEPSYRFMFEVGNKRKEYAVTRANGDEFPESSRVFEGVSDTLCYEFPGTNLEMMEIAAGSLTLMKSASTT